MHTFTMGDLLQFLYNETSQEKTAAIKEALQQDWSLREKMNILTGTHAELNKVELLSPRQQSLDNIMSYAEKAVEATAETV